MKLLIENWRWYLNEVVDDVFTGNCGMFGIALAEEAQRRGIKDVALVFAHNADTDEEMVSGDYKIYHIALQIGDKIYDGRGEIPLSKLVSFMWFVPEDMNVDSFDLINFDQMKRAIRRNTAWDTTCEHFKDKAKEFLDEMGYVNEGDDTTKHILDALDKFKDYDMDEQLFALIDALLGIENPQYKDLEGVFDILGNEDRTKEGYMLTRYLSHKNSNEVPR